MTNEQMTRTLKLHKFLHTYDAQIMTHHASHTRTTHRVALAVGVILHQKLINITFFITNLMLNIFMLNIFLGGKISVFWGNC